MRGASASQKIFEQLPAARIKILVVWEPMLVTDRSAPDTPALARISDPRAQQFWDPQHLVAREIVREKKADPTVSEPICCTDNDIFWDMAAIYPPESRWESTAPRPQYLNGAVIRRAGQIEDQLRGLMH